MRPATSAGPAFRDVAVGRGIAVGDVDNDGRPDILLTNNNGPVASAAQRSRRRRPLAGGAAGGTARGIVSESVLRVGVIRKRHGADLAARPHGFEYLMRMICARTSGWASVGNP